MNSTVQKEKRHFNVVDFLIILTLIAVAAFAVNYITNDLFSGESATVEYILRVTGVRQTDALKLQNGSAFSSSAGVTLGTVKEIQSKDATTVLFDETSRRFVTAVIPEKVTLYLRIQADCLYKNNRYVIGDIRISANTSPEVLMPFSYENAEIVSVSAVIPAPEAA